MRIAVLTGAGISAESGISTFRDNDGLWEKYRVEDVASIEGWYRNRALVLDFYNRRRRELASVEPNAAHRLLASLEKEHEVTVITQNVDNLHERGGSTDIIHLHGELVKACGEDSPDVPYEIGYSDIKVGDKAPDGSQARPFIVWFGEAVPRISDAAEVVSRADLLLVVGTSLNVYPAAGLLAYAGKDVPVYIIDPKDVRSGYGNRIIHIKDVATSGMERFMKMLESCR